MDKFPTLHSPKNELYQTSSHLMSSVSCQNDRTLSGPVCKNICSACWLEPAGTSNGLDARKVPETGLNCQKSAHMTTLIPPKARSVLSGLFLPAPLTAPCTAHNPSCAAVVSARLGYAHCLGVILLSIIFYSRSSHFEAIGRTLPSVF